MIEWRAALPANQLPLPSLPASPNYLETYLVTLRVNHRQNGFAACFEYRVLTDPHDSDTSSKIRKENSSFALYHQIRIQRRFSIDMASLK